MGVSQVEEGTLVALFPSYKGDLGGPSQALWETKCSTFSDASSTGQGIDKITSYEPWGRQGGDWGVLPRGGSIRLKLIGLSG